MVAPQLIGKYLVVRDVLDSTRERIGRIVETEAYEGPDDLAAHSRRGTRTQRTEVMFGPPGRAYVYLIYGIHHCFNIVTERAGVPHAVLIRALEPIAGFQGSASGPGLVCGALGINLGDNAAPLTRGRIRLESWRDGRDVPELVARPRINVDYAGAWALTPWRFLDPESPALSRDPDGRPPRKRSP